MMGTSTTRPRIDALLRQDLAQRGMRLTEQRRLILATVRGTENHPTAEWVHGAVRRRLPRVSLATVYRNLRLLARQGLLSELRQGPSVRFDARVDRHHHFMMIEIEEKDQIQPELDRFMGIDSGEHVWLQIGHEFAIPGQFEAGHSKEDKIAAVHFVRFALPPAARRAFEREPVALVVDHPNYRARTELTPDTRTALLGDLREGRPPSP